MMMIRCFTCFTPMMSRITTGNGARSAASGLRPAQSGSALIIMLCLLLLVVLFSGVAMYTGMQAFYANEAQKTLDSATMAGAAAYYQMDANGQILPNPGYAQSVVRNTFNQAVNAGSLRGGNYQITNLSTDNNGGISVQVSGATGTALLAPSGITEIRVQAQSNARAMRYVPTLDLGTVYILPEENNLQSYSRMVHLAFPISNGQGYELLVEQAAHDQQGYVIEACNESECYDLGPGATPIGTARRVTRDGATILYGSAVIDLGRAGVNKASSLRITHGNDFIWYNNGAEQEPSLVPRPLIIDQISIFGFARMCPTPGNCPLPHGYQDVAAN